MALEVMAETDVSSKKSVGNISKKDEASDVKFFGEVDIDEKGNITSSMPAWSMSQHIEQHEEEANKLRGALERGSVPQKDIADMKERLKQMDEKIVRIKESRPKLTDKQKDIVSRGVKEIGMDISNYMPSRSDMMKGLANPQHEHDRNTKPCIRLRNSEMINIAKSCGAKVHGNMVSRNDASRMYSIMSKSIELNPSVEKLRRD